MMISRVIVELEHHVDGMDPVNVLLNKAKVVSCTRFPNVDGMDPDNSLLTKSNLVRLTRFPNVNGTDPIS